MKTSRPPSFLPRHHGFSLVELMIAMAIGLFLTAMMGVLFQNVSRANREQFQAAEQQENGRYAMELITNDLRTAGYYGEFAALPTVPAVLPDPCAVPLEGEVTTATTNSPLAFYVQGYPATAANTLPIVPGTCGVWMDNATLRAGSDILVIRRLATTKLIDSEAAAPVLSADSIAGEVYAQTSAEKLRIQYGSGTTISGYAGADGVTPTQISDRLTRKDFSQAVDPVSATRPTTGAYIRKLIVHIYFVANCRQGNGANGTCVNGDDTIPTLKRIELTFDPTTNAPAMALVPLVDGIEFMKVYYGLDRTSAIAGKMRDGAVDAMAMVNTPTVIADWRDVVVGEIRIVSRNTRSSLGYSDSKAYDLGGSINGIGGISFTPSGQAANFKRHMLVSRTFLENIGGRRDFTP